MLHSYIGSYFYVKEGYVGTSIIYLGDKVSKVTLQNGVDTWSFSLSQYFQAVIYNVDKYLKEWGK